MLEERDCLVLDSSLYDVCLCVNFGSDGCSRTATLGTDAVYETTLGAGTGWGARTCDCRVNSDGSVV